MLLRRFVSNSDIPSDGFLFAPPKRMVSVGMQLTFRVFCTEYVIIYALLLILLLKEISSCIVQLKVTQRVAAGEDKRPFQFETFIILRGGGVLEQLLQLLMVLTHSRFSDTM